MEVVMKIDTSSNDTPAKQIARQAYEATVSLINGALSAAHLASGGSIDGQTVEEATKKRGLDRAEAVHIMNTVALAALKAIALVTGPPEKMPNDEIDQNHFTFACLAVLNSATFNQETINIEGGALVLAKAAKDFEIRMGYKPDLDPNLLAAINKLNDAGTYAEWQGKASAEKRRNLN